MAGNTQNNQKMEEAYKAMACFGFPEEKVKATLGRLVKLYNHDWTFIEEENYGVLIDALMKDSTEESKRVEIKKDRPLLIKSKMGVPIKKKERPLLIKGENRVECRKKEGPLLTKETKQAKFDSGDDGSDDESGEINCTLKRCSSSKYEQASSSVVNFPNKKARMSYSLAAQDKGKIEPFHKNVLDISNNELSHKKLPGSDAPLTVTHPGLLSEGNSSKRNCSASKSKADDPKFLELKPRVYGISNLSNFDIASSANEEVKISLICNSSGNTYFRSQSLDAVLGEVEDKCRRTYGIQDPNFSLKKLMENVCEFFLEMGNESNKECAPLILDRSGKSGGKDLGPKDDSKHNYNLRPSHSKEAANHQNIIKGFSDASEKKIKPLKDPQSSKSHSMEAVIQKKYPIYLKDIARGKENVQIPLVNGWSALELPNFMYIKSNMFHKDAHIDFSLARLSDDNCCVQCYGDCLSSILPCACAGETQGEFAYTQEGLLKEEFLDECIAMCREPQRKYFYYCEICPLTNDPLQKGKRVKPCKGHLTRKFIKECWYKCGCHKKCGNRVVQRGIQVALQVFATPEGKGWGVRSVHALKKGTFVCEYVGEIVTNQELDDRNKERAAKKERHTYPVLLDADWGSERILKDEEALCLDATEFGNVGRFINHRCDDANLIEIPVEVETPDHHYYHLAFFTTRDIQPMEELTWDYGIEFDDIYHPVKAFKCKCGSEGCHDKKKAVVTN